MWGFLSQLEVPIYNPNCTPKFFERVALWIYELSFRSTTQNQTYVWNSILTTNCSMLFFRRLWRTWFLAHSQPSPILQRNVGRRTVEASCASSTLRILNFRFDPCHMGFPAATWRDGTLKLVSRRSDRMC